MSFSFDRPPLRSLRGGIAGCIPRNIAVKGVVKLPVTGGADVGCFNVRVAKPRGNGKSDTADDVGSAWRTIRSGAGARCAGWVIGVLAAVFTSSALLGSIAGLGGISGVRFFTVEACGTGKWMISGKAAIRSGNDVATEASTGCQAVTACSLACFAAACDV